MIKSFVSVQLNWSSTLFDLIRQFQHECSLITYPLCITQVSREIHFAGWRKRSKRRYVYSAVTRTTMVSSARINFQNCVRIISQGLITLWNVGAPTIRRASFQQRPNECSILSIILFSFYLVFHSLDSFFFFPRRESNPREKKHPIGTRCCS